MYIVSNTFYYSFGLLILCLNVDRIISETGPNHGKAVVCYWATWSSYRADRGNFKSENIDPTLCTHLIIAFTVLDDAEDAIKLVDDWVYLRVDENNQNNITKWKAEYPHLKILVSIGGWQDGSIKYSTMAGDPVKRSNFVNNSVEFISKHDFDGLDIFWQYPAKRGGSFLDKVNFVQLVKELRIEFDKHNYLLTAALGASKDTIDNGYDIPGLSSQLDLMSVMCYDYHGWWSRHTGANAPLHSAKFLNAEFTIKHMLKLGADPEKLILGVPLFGRTFLMVESTPPSVEPPRFGGGFENHTFVGKFTQDEGGSIGYNEICLEIYDNKGWTVHWDFNSKTPYAVNGQKLITYDNDRSLIEKTRFAMQNNLRGIMAWSIDTDDFHGDCYEFIDGHREFPLLRAINSEMNEFIQNQQSYLDRYNSIEASAIVTNTALTFRLNYFVLLTSTLFAWYVSKVKFV